MLAVKLLTNHTPKLRSYRSPIRVYGSKIQLIEKYSFFQTKNLFRIKNFLTLLTEPFSGKKLKNAETIRFPRKIDIRFNQAPICMLTQKTKAPRMIRTMAPVPSLKASFLSVS